VWCVQRVALLRHFFTSFSAIDDLRTKNIATFFCDQEHADELASRGYEFWVIPKAGLVHHPHDRMDNAWPTDYLLESKFHWRLPQHIHFLAKIFGHPIADPYFSKIPLNILNVEEQHNEVEKRLIHLRLIFQSTHMVSPVARDKLFAV